MRVFSKEKFIQAEGQEIYEKCKGWVDLLDGKTVVAGKVDGYISSYDWEIERGANK